MAARLPILKTPKCYLGGAFIRSESGRVMPLHDARGNFIAHLPQCTRKDLRNAVEVAAKSVASWSKRSAYNRGQIFYRLAEMMEARSAELAVAITIGGTSLARAKREVAAAIDRLVYYAGWTDKYEQVLGSVNPVASSHFNFTTAEPIGVVGIIAPHQTSLLGLISLIAPAIASGNAVVALASETEPYPSLLLGEMLATSDLPSGVVNLLTGAHKDLLPTLSSHEQIRAIAGVVNHDESKQIRESAADSVKRVHLRLSEDKIDWFASREQGLEAIRQFIEFKTTWHPIGA